jgi:uncharacterized membrane protein
MTPVLIALSYWLHELATVVFIGYFVLLATIYLPVLSRVEYRSALSEISKRSRSWMYAVLLVFIVTGVYLLMADPNYLGMGNFNNAWSVIMLLKHLLIVVMIAMGFWFNAILRVGPLMSSNTGAAQAISRFRWYVQAMALCGILVLLLTALAQVE